MGKARAVGYALAVNGELKSADIYASPDLFSAMWPKLLKSSALEALRLREKETKVPPQVSRVEAFLREADGSKESGRENWVHRRVLKK